MVYVFVYTGFVIELTDERGRTLRAEGRTVNRIGLHLNPNLFTVNSLTEWSFDGVTAFGEDHDNWSAPAIRKFARNFLGYELNQEKAPSA